MLIELRDDDEVRNIDPGAFDAMGASVHSAGCALPSKEALG